MLSCKVGGLYFIVHNLYETIGTYITIIEVTIAGSQRLLFVKFRSLVQTLPFTIHLQRPVMVALL
jgi:hypothetical protein